MHSIRPFLLFWVQHSTLSEYLYKLPVWGWALHSVRVIMYTSCLGLSTALCQSSYIHFMFLVEHWTHCHLQRYSAGKGCCLSITFFKMLITNLMWTHQKNLCKHIYQFLRKKRVKRTIKWQNINFLGERETCWNWWQWKKVSPIIWQWLGNVWGYTKELEYWPRGPNIIEKCGFNQHPRNTSKIFQKYISSRTEDIPIFV